MKFFDTTQVAIALPWGALLAAIEQTMAADGAEAPERTVHSITVPGEADASLLLKPGWVIGDVIAVKAVTFFPENGTRNMPSTASCKRHFPKRLMRTAGRAEANVARPSKNCPAQHPILCAGC